MNHDDHSSELSKDNHEDNSMSMHHHMHHDATEKNASVSAAKENLEMDHNAHHHDMNAMNHAGHKMSHMHHGEMAMDDMGGMDHSMHMGNFKQKFWLSLIIAIPILILSPMMGVTLPFQFTFPGSNWVVMILATILFFYGGQPFLSGAKMELQMKSPGMMTLIAMGISVAYFYSMYAFVVELVTGQMYMDFFWELATLIVIMLLGHWIEMSAVSNAGNALQKLAELLPSSVKRLLSNGQTEEVPLTAVHNGDILLVSAGDKVPADGEITSGSTSINESALTGESLAVEKKVGSKVIGGSVNGNGVFQMKVAGIGQDSYLSQVMEMVKKAQSEKSRLESISDKVAKWLFYVALAAGILALIIWWIVSDFSIALERMVTTFIIACPHALGLAIPLVIARSTSIAAKNGLLIKNRNALEQASSIDMVLLDKTGTLTEGNFSVTGVEIFAEDYSKEEVLKYVGGLEAQSNHPLAEGIMDYIKSQSIDIYSGGTAQVIAGVGLKGVINNKNAAIVNQKELAKRALNVDETALTGYLNQGNTISFLLIDDHLIAAIALGDTIKPTAKNFIQQLKAKNITPVMLTGDNQKAAAAVATYLGMDVYHSELLPNDKEKIVADYVKEGKKVMMVGDGINDAPSLTRATIGVAIGAGTDVAIDSADVVLTASNPDDILRLLDLSKNTHRKMVQNLWWAAGYNIVAIPLAAGILAPVGFLLSPAVGAIIMSLSTVVVAINALLLKL
ncbi:heavy metal translocating P-type ATPase [Enterococcus sp. HY326]|uniref:heavy metal translocating P-type ATPase n=1 Tax=Enterococcus sp. HY326 TaxID=2971265 RepID=UPI003A0FCB03